MKVGFEKDILKEHRDLTTRKAELSEEQGQISEMLSSLREMSTQFKSKVDDDERKAKEELSTLKADVADLDDNVKVLNNQFVDEVSIAWILRVRGNIWFAEFVTKYSVVLADIDCNKQMEILSMNKQECIIWGHQTTRRQSIKDLNDKIDDAETIITRDTADMELSLIYGHAAELNLATDSKTMKKLSRLMSMYWQDLSNWKHGKEKNNSISKQLTKLGTK